MLMMIKLTLSRLSRDTSYITLVIEDIILLLCCILFVPLFFLRSLWLRFPIRCIQGPIPIYRLYFTVASSAVVFYLLGFGPPTLLFPLDPMRLQITWLLIGPTLLLINGYNLSIVRWLLFSVVSTAVTIMAWSSSTLLHVVG